MSIEHVLSDAARAADRSPEDATIARVVRRLSGEYLLRSLRLNIEAFGDVVHGVIAMTILVANTAHLDLARGEGWRYAGLDTPPPDELRKPISISRVADSLGLPFETTRRHVSRLTREGACVRVEGGVILPTAFLVSRAPARTLANVSYVRKFLRDLHAIGLVAEDDAYIGADAEEAGEDAGFARVVMRISSAYVLRGLGLLVGIYGDIRTALIARTIFTANKAHLDGAGR
jgi:hypothetical protein